MIKYRELAYYLFFLMLFGFRAIGGHDGWTSYRWFLMAGGLFFLIKVFSTSHSILEYLVMALLLILAGIVYLRSGEKGLLLDIMMMIGIKGVSEKKLFHLSAIFLGISMIVLVFLSVFGILPDVQFGPYGLRFVDLVMMRRSLGYPHVNTLMTTYIILLMLIMYQIGNTDKKTVIRYSSILFFGAVYLFLYSDSITGILMSGAYLILNYLFQFCRFDGPVQRILIYILYPVVNVTVFIGRAMYLPRDAALRAGNSFGERFRIAAMYWKEMPVTMFGSRLVIPTDRGELYGIDISQIHLFLNLGIVAFLVVSLLYMIVLREMFAMKNRGALAIIVTLMIMGISDPLLYNLSCKNLTFIFMGMGLYRVLSNRSKERLSILKKEILLFSAGERAIPARISLRFEKVNQKISRIIKDGKPGKHVKYLAVGCAIIVAMVYAFWMHPYIEPIMNSYEAGWFEYVRTTISIGVFGFLLMYALLHLRASKRM